MPYCTNCKHFVSIDSSVEPEVDSLELGDDGQVTGTVAITNQCSECGQDLRQASFDVDVLLKDFDDHTKTCDEFKANSDGASVDFNDVERTEEQRPPRARRRATFYGASGEVEVTCACGDTFTKSWADQIKASEMEQT